MEEKKLFNAPLCYTGYDLWLLREWLLSILEEEGLSDYYGEADFLYDSFLGYAGTPHLPGFVIDRESLHVKEKWDPWVSRIRELSEEIREAFEGEYETPEGMPFYHTENLFKDVVKKLRKNRESSQEDEDYGFGEFS